MLKGLITVGVSFLTANAIANSIQDRALNSRIEENAKRKAKRDERDQLREEALGDGSNLKTWR